MKTKFYYLLPVFLLLLAGAGCSQKKGIVQSENTTNEKSDVAVVKTVAGDTKVFNLTGKNYSFSLSEIKVKKGDKVKINFTSEEGYHDWVVDQFKAKTKAVLKGGETSVEFIVDKTGSFEYYCSVGNHRKNGMVGKLIVEDTSSTTTEIKTNVMSDKTTVMSDLDFQGTVLGGKVAKVYDFVNSDYQSVLQSDKLIVLYFYASWCPLCRAEFPKMTDAFAELDSNKVVGFRVNFNDPDTDSTEKDLAKQFGVAYQHTKVFVQNNKQILKSPESWDKTRYGTEINKIIK